MDVGRGLASAMLNLLPIENCQLKLFDSQQQLWLNISSSVTVGGVSFDFPLDNTRDVTFHTQ